MKTILLGLVLLLSTGCTDDLEVGPSSAANAKATEAAPATTSIDALATNFDPEKAAPATAAASDGHDHHAHGHGSADQAATEYTCPHHPEVVSDKPGICPKCKMDLVPKKPEPKKMEATQADAKPAGAKPADTKPAAATQYTCPHHPEVVSDKPGICPKCKMDLVPKKPEPKKTDAKPAHDHGAHP